jgi:hypothetical protein
MYRLQPFGESVKAFGLLNWDLKMLSNPVSECEGTSRCGALSTDRRAKKARAPSIGKRPTAYIVMSSGLVGIAIAMRLYGLGGQEWIYDEGVYWQTLRAMRAGFGLYDQVFCSQPPLFFLSIYPFYAILGQSILAARAAIAAFSLLGLLGAYMMGNAIASRAGAIGAMVLVIFMPLYLYQSQALQPEGPSTAFLLLSVGAALIWWKCSPKKKIGAILAMLCGAALAFGLLIKLLNITALAPIFSLIVWRLWASRQESSGNTVTILTHVALGLIAAVLIALIGLLPFLMSARVLVDQVVKFHLAAENVSQTNNFQILRQFFISNGALSIAAMMGTIVALVRRDWLVIPLAAWLSATIALLVLHAPLFDRHAIVLIPPLVAMAVLGLGDLSGVINGIRSKRMFWIQVSAMLTGLLISAATAQAIPLLYNYYYYHTRNIETDEVHLTAKISADLRRVTTHSQWIVTDEQFFAAMADRDTPPSLVDTSSVRILTGYLTNQQLIDAASDPRVEAVLFTSGRLRKAPIAAFHDWVAQHFGALHSYGPGIELWTR